MNENNRALLDQLNCQKGINNTKNALELVFINKPNLIVKSGVKHVGIDDHVQYDLFKYYNIPLFKSDLKEIFSTNVCKSHESKLFMP